VEQNAETCSRTLKHAVEKHNGEDWAAISALVLGRTNRQCLNIWHNVLESETDEEAWAEEVPAWAESG
jgi:hypothetical protein